MSLYLQVGRHSSNKLFGLPGSVVGCVEHKEAISLKQYSEKNFVFPEWMRIPASSEKKVGSSYLFILISMCSRSLTLPCPTRNTKRKRTKKPQRGDHLNSLLPPSRLQELQPPFLLFSPLQLSCPEMNNNNKQVHHCLLSNE